MPKKDPVQNVNQTVSITMDLQETANNVSGVDDAESDLFGNVLMLKNVTSSLGSNSGFKKAIPSADSHSFLDTAHSKSSKSKMIGLINFQPTTLISPKSNTSFMMVPISDETTALSPSWML